ncbi:MAG: hypothetical protein OXC71_08180 [Chloroflexi bacterium]|nr:hypothetical protein [Chloroflexota bacterium]
MDTLATPDELAIRAVPVVFGLARLAISSSAALKGMPASAASG